MTAIYQSLLLAREAVKKDHYQWDRHSTHHRKKGRDLYYWCHAGWRQNSFRGYGWGVSNALRKHVPDGDLTGWWQHGRSRGDVVFLFTLAIEETRENVPA